MARVSHIALLAAPKGWLGCYAHRRLQIAWIYSRPRLNGLRQTPTQAHGAFERHDSREKADHHRVALCGPISCVVSGSKPTKSDDGRPKERSAGTQLPANAAASCRFARGYRAALIRQSHSSANQINLQISLTVSTADACSGARANPSAGRPGTLHEVKPRSRRRWRCSY